VLLDGVLHLVSVTRVTQIPKSVEMHVCLLLSLLYFLSVITGTFYNICEKYLMWVVDIVLTTWLVIGAAFLPLVSFAGSKRIRLMGSPVRAPGRNAPLIHLLISALYIICLFISYAFPLIPFLHFLVHGQVTIIFVVSVGLSVCLFVCLCRVFLSRLWSNFDQTWTYVIRLGLVVSPRI